MQPGVWCSNRPEYGHASRCHSEGQSTLPIRRRATHSCPKSRGSVHRFAPAISAQEARTFGAPSHVASTGPNHGTCITPAAATAQAHTTRACAGGHECSGQKSVRKRAARGRHRLQHQLAMCTHARPTHARHSRARLARRARRLSGRASGRQELCTTRGEAASPGSGDHAHACRPRPQPGVDPNPVQLAVAA